MDDNEVILLTHNRGTIRILVRRLLGSSRGGRQGGTTSDDVRGQPKSSGHVEPPWLGNDLQVASLGEKLVDGLGQEVGSLLKERVLKSTTNIQKLESIPSLLAHVEDRARTTNGVSVHRRVVAAATDMETDTDDIKVQFLGFRQQTRDGDERGTKFDTKGAQTFRVVRENAHDAFSARMGTSNFVKLVGIVKGHHIDPHFSCIADKGSRLAWVGKNDVGGINSANAQDIGDFIIGGTVEACAKGSQEANDIGIRVAFDRCSSQDIVSS